ncbi:hypothetical protein H8B13_18260 [Hymenobacter sp. BT188]|uniref:protease pro-enzyme activation domain-containing protein n=1 Tax=Hymenobacter sp. BT188 TaxID=2763504 RepID=UPI0016514E65|nr:protease pro-enzyme activation domain-containing protein [Hymenobacter sp. BT188]MBC6608778.1 hypothetical protein [Hymenobacter sp. BT188]
MESTERIYAQVVLQAPSGQSAASTTATAEQVDHVRPIKAATEQAVDFMKKAGFRVEQAGITLSVSGTKQQFESVFGIHLSAYEQAGQTYYRPDHPALIPATAPSCLQTIVFAEPRQYFN